jgi:hypothetical protein
VLKLEQGQVLVCQYLSWRKLMMELELPQTSVNKNKKKINKIYTN